MSRASRGAWLLLLGLFLCACSAESGPNLSDQPANVSAWRARLAKGDPAAVKSLQKSGVGATPLLKQLLADEDVTVVTNAGLVAEGLGEDTFALAPQLLAAVVRFPGDSRLLGPLRAGSAKPALAPYLLGILETGTPTQKAAALDVLTHYGPLAAPGVPAIVPLLKAEKELTRLHAMNTLSGIGAGAVPALGDLEAAREAAKSAHERRTAATAIKYIKAKAKRAQAASGG